MTLTDAELELVRRIERREETWQWGRWVVLLLGLLMVGLASFFLGALWLELRQEHLVVMLVTVMAPVCALFLFGGGLCILYVVRFWKGRAVDRLLLRLMPETYSGS